jgi:hypothetical protein
MWREIKAMAAGVIEQLSVNVEIIFHFIALMASVLVAVLIMLDGVKFVKAKQSLHGGALIAIASYLCLLALYMIINVLRYGEFFVANKKAGSTEVVAMVFIVAVLASIFFAFKLTLFKNMVNNNESALVLRHGVDSMTPQTSVTVAAGKVTADNRVQTEFVRVQDSQGDKGAFTLTMWLGLQSSHLRLLFAQLANDKPPSLLSADKSRYEVRIPLFLRGIPKMYYVNGGLDADTNYGVPNAALLVKCPLINLVISVQQDGTPNDPFFEVDFGHMEGGADPIRNPNSCYVQDAYTSRCTFFENNVQMDVHDALKLGNASDATALHFVSMVFKEEYSSSTPAALKKDLYTNISVYIDDLRAKQSNLFPGQVRLMSSRVSVLPKELLDFQTIGLSSDLKNGISNFLAASKLGTTTYYSYPLSESALRSKFYAGMDETTKTANSPDTDTTKSRPGNNDRAVVQAI